MIYSAAAARLRVLLLTSRFSASFSPKKLPKYGPALLMLRHHRSHEHHTASLQQFRPLTADHVISAVRRLPDPIPTSVLKQIVDVIAPFITELFNRSIQAGHFQTTFKEAFITPTVKKSGLDTTSASSYRPISNLCLIEALGASRCSPADGVPYIC